MDNSVPTAAGGLLDFIAGPESGGNYDAIVGNRQNDPGWPSPPVTTMTINELLAAQAQWIHDFNFSASGRYQVTRATLQTLINQLGLSGNEMFDANMQDRLGYKLLQNCGYDGFMAGTKPFDDFALSLAKTWAGLPVLRDMQGPNGPVTAGQSYYAGDGTNVAGVTPGALRGALNTAKPPPVPPKTGGYYTGGGCFLGSTLVQMADGSFRAICDVRRGDAIHSIGEVVTSQGEAIVSENRRSRHKNYLEVILSNDTVLHVSWRQEFGLPGGRRVRASHLHIGQYLENLSGREVRVVALRLIPAEVEMFDLQMSNPARTSYVVGIQRLVMKPKP